jgi:hypothetical protein
MKRKAGKWLKWEEHLPSKHEALSSSLFNTSFSRLETALTE